MEFSDGGNSRRGLARRDILFTPPGVILTSSLIVPSTWFGRACRLRDAEIEFAKGDADHLAERFVQFEPRYGIDGIRRNILRVWSRGPVPIFSRDLTLMTPAAEIAPGTHAIMRIRLAVPSALRQLWIWCEAVQIVAEEQGEFGRMLGFRALGAGEDEGS